MLHFKYPFVHYVHFIAVAFLNFPEMYKNPWPNNETQLPLIKTKKKKIGMESKLKGSK